MFTCSSFFFFFQDFFLLELLVVGVVVNDVIVGCAVEKVCVNVESENVEDVIPNPPIVGTVWTVNPVWVVVGCDVENVWVNVGCDAENVWVNVGCDAENVWPPMDVKWSPDKDWNWPAVFSYIIII